MDAVSETSLLIKAAWSAAVVLGLTLVAERVGSRIAGILSGAPLTAVLVFFFVGQDLGVDYVVASIPHSIAAFTGTVCFVLVYYWTSARLNRFSAIGALALGIAAFFAVAGLLSNVPFTLLTATALTLATILLAAFLVRKAPAYNIGRPIKFTIAQIMLRGGVAALLITAVIYLAETVGPHWTGLLVGFPATLLPTYLIIHLTYGKTSTRAMIRSFPAGVPSLILYLGLVPFTFPAWGIWGGTAACLAASTAYLTTIMFLGRKRPFPAPPAMPALSRPPDPP